MFRPLRIALIACLFTAASPIAVSEVMIAPTRVVLENGERSAELVLVNKGSEEGAFRISLENRRMLLNGSLETAEDAREGELFADDFVRFAPRRALLEPGGRQTIRVSANTAGLAPGEYRSHLRVMGAPTSAGRTLAEATGTDGDAISIELIALRSLTIPVIVRVGELDAEVTIETAATAPSDEEGESLFVARLTRTGERSTYGDLQVFVQGQAELLYGSDDHLVSVIFREQAAHQGLGVGVLFDAALLEAVELFTGLAVEVFAVDDEETLVDVRVNLEKRRSLEARQRLAAAGGVPNVAVAAILFDALDDPLHGVDLVGAHHQQLLLAGDKHGVPTDHVTERAFGEEPISEVVEVRDLGVVFRRELIDRQEAFFRVESEVTGVVIGKVPRVGAVADDEELDEAEKRPGVAVAGVVLVVDDLLHGPARADAEGFELDLNGRDPVDEQHHVVAVVAIVGVDAELVDDLEGVLAPVFDVNQGVVEGRAVVAGEAVSLAEGARGGEDIGRDDLVEEALELTVGERDAV